MEFEAAQTAETPVPQCGAGYYLCPDDYDNHYHCGKCGAVSGPQGCGRRCDPNAPRYVRAGTQDECSAEYPLVMCKGCAQRKHKDGALAPSERRSARPTVTDAFVRMAATMMFGVFGGIVADSVLPPRRELSVWNGPRVAFLPKPPPTWFFMLPLGAAPSSATLRGNIGTRELHHVTRNPEGRYVVRQGERVVLDVDQEDADSMRDVYGSDMVGPVDEGARA